MKAYRFSLATVMRIRKLEERLARERLMLVQRELRIAQGDYRALQERLSRLSVPSTVVPVEEVRWIADQADRLAEELREREVALLEILERRTALRQAWNVARKRSSALERLDEQSRARWRDEALRAEAAELDDVSTTRHARLGVGA